MIRRDVNLIYNRIEGLGFMRFLQLIEDLGFQSFRVQGCWDRMESLRLGIWVLGIAVQSLVF